MRRRYRRGPFSMDELARLQFSLPADEMARLSLFPDQMTLPEAPIVSPEAVRQRRFRARARRHEIVCPTPICGGALNALIALRWLREEDCEDRTKIGEAIAGLLRDLAQ